MGVSFKRFLIGLVVIMAGIIAPAQDYDSLRLARLPKLALPETLKSSGLPYKVDNSRTRHFPPIFTQYGYSCNQAATISVGYTYELNAMRNLDGSLQENQLPAFFTWNMMNGGVFDRGVSYFESWDLVHAAGTPAWPDYGNYLISETRWMSGYDRYYRSMGNRVDEIYSLDVSTEQGLLTLKHWLYDHLGTYQPGGVANFQLATLDLQFWPLPKGTEDAGKIMIPHFGYAVGHAMTFTGYNDSVRYDFNHDGRYTNHIDTNGDGQVTMADREIGALICVNTYGTEWGTEGRAYVPYRILPLHPDQGGIWMKSVVVAKPCRNYRPLLTLRAQLRYPVRSKIWITAGVSQDPAATGPLFVLDKPVFQYQGGDLPMQGRGPADPALIEIGIDATQLLSHLESGKPAAFFLVVCEQDPSSSIDGTILDFEFIEYTGGETRHPGSRLNIPVDRPFQSVPVLFTPGFDGPVVATAQLPGATAGEEYRTQLAASGGTAPYKWLPVGNIFTESRFEAPYPALFQNRILPAAGNPARKTVTLPFDFPFNGSTYREITVTASGGILLNENTLYIPYGRDLREMLGLNQAIYPFYSTELEYPDYLSGVFYETTPSVVTIGWRASIPGTGESSEVNFAVRIFPSGVIEFLYGSFLNNTRYPWLTGLACGSKALSHYPAVNATGISSGLNIRFRPPVLPAGLEISRDGLLSCKPKEPGRNWTIPVAVEDYQGIQSRRDLTLSTTPLGIHLPDQDAGKIRIYPNPVTDPSGIRLESDRSGDITLNILDLTGKVVVTGRYAIRAGNNVLALDPAGIPAPGIYLVGITGAATCWTKIYMCKIP